MVIIESPPDELDRPGAARTILTGTEIHELAALLDVVDGGARHLCRCLGSPTFLAINAQGKEIRRWTLHHQEWIRDGGFDAPLLDASALIGWLAERGLSGSVRARQAIAAERARDEERRVRWVAAGPKVLMWAVEAASRREPGAEDKLITLLREHHPDRAERIAMLLAWASLAARSTDGTPWHELIPRRMLLAESDEALLAVVTGGPLTPSQLDGAADLFTSLEWTRPPRSAIPESLRMELIAHVVATGTEPMKFRMRHGYGKYAV
ncbi:hypothetical protein [Hamadaea tsunoensis]|uniref:hypothetical protein n=1 Tax=Hamadaea tsunoensis TaxID=53368 RepID=UPI000405B4B6|nr:hypothetical protein [Hamadaea tsunoensis]